MGLVENLSGVGALIVVPENLERGFVTIKELTTKRSSAKLAGMVSLPMETLEPGEDHNHALRRAIQGEELALRGIELDKCLTEIVLGRYELTPGVVLRCFVVNVPESVQIGIGTASEEVGLPSWTKFSHVLNNPRDSLRYRPGVREVVDDYLRYLTAPQSFLPSSFRHYELSTQVPKSAFDTYESEVFRKSA